METELATAQQTAGGIQQAPKNVFFIPDEELKDFYLKFAVLQNPNACSVNRTEFELLNILLKDLKKTIGTLTHINTHAWNEGMAEIQTSCGVYCVQDNISKKERIQMSAALGQHLQFLTQMATNSYNLKQLYENYTRHYINVERLVRQMAMEKEND